MLQGTASPADLSQFRPQDAGGWKPGLAMALFVHLLLVGALALGVHWKIQEPAPVEAEVWTDLPQVQEPLPHPSETPPVVTPPPTPEPPPEPAVEKPQEKPADLSIAPVKPKVAKPRIEKEPPKPPKKELKKKEPKEVFLPDLPKKVPPKAEVKPEKVPPKVVPPAKPVVDPKAEARAKAAEAARAKTEEKNLAAQRQANLDRLMRNLAQDQSSSAGISDSYKGRIVARVRPNIIFPAAITGNPEALVRVECNAEGRITRTAILAGSGNEQWDQAVIRALERTQVLPQDEHKRVPCPFDFVFRPDIF